MYSRLPKCTLQQFKYLQGITRDPIFVASTSIYSKMLMGYLRSTMSTWCQRMYVVCQLLVHETQYTITLNNFIEFLILIWHEFQKEIHYTSSSEDTRRGIDRAKYVVDVLPIYQCIVSIGRNVMSKEEFQKGTLWRIILQAILSKV